MTGPIITFPRSPRTLSAVQGWRLTQDCLPSLGCAETLEDGTAIQQADHETPRGFIDTGQRANVQFERCRTEL